MLARSAHPRLELLPGAGAGAQRASPPAADAAPEDGVRVEGLLGQDGCWKLGETQGADDDVHPARPLPLLGCVSCRRALGERKVAAQSRRPPRQLVGRRRRRGCQTPRGVWRGIHGCCDG